MLGETFEDPRMKFIAEKVFHNPVIMAYHAEGEGWELWATSAGRTKFWGNGLYRQIISVRKLTPYLLLQARVSRSSPLARYM